MPVSPHKPAIRARKSSFCTRTNPAELRAAPLQRRTRRRGARAGFSMVEAMIAVTITTVAGGALLASLGGAVRSSTEAMQSAVARGLAEQLMEEIAASRFPSDTNPTPVGAARTGFDDIDDFAGWSARPPVDRLGSTLGQDGRDSSGLPATRPEGLQPDADFVSCFTREVLVERVEPDTGSGWNVVSQHTNFRRVMVRVSYTDARSQTRTLAELTRIFSYVPVAP